MMPKSPIRFKTCNISASCFDPFKKGFLFSTKSLTKRLRQAFVSQLFDEAHPLLPELLSFMIFHLNIPNQMLKQRILFIF